MVRTVNDTRQSCLIMLSILVMMSLFYQGHAVVDYGRDFVTAFPENIAYYYPSNLTNILKITALHDNTHFTLTFNDSSIIEALAAGQSKIVYLPEEVEEHQLSRSNKTVRITSDNDIVVFSVSQRGDSIQTNVVQPVTNLGSVYLIPFPNFTEIILMLNNYTSSDSSGSSGSSTSSQTYNFFRLLIINAEEKETTVTLTLRQSRTSTSDTSFNLSPFEFIQMQSNDSLVKVTASANISVLLTHPCLDTYDCRCAIVVHQLRPTNLQGDNFIVPPLYVTSGSQMFSTSDQSIELTYGSPPLSGSQTLDAGNSDPLRFYQQLQIGFSNITASRPVSLRIMSNGSLVDLVPVSMFSACYLVHSTSSNKTQALIIVETSQSSNTRVESGNFTPAFTWNIINGTKYSWAALDLRPLRPHIIWHPFSKMAVYVVNRMATDVVYGGPAISINEQPDPSGCLLSPSDLIFDNQSVSWPESRQYCLGKGGQLASPSWAAAQSYMAQKLTQIGATGQAWIGLRRSLLTTEWYWQSGQNFAYSNWEQGNPANPEKGMCASVRMEPNGNFTWSSVRCCTTMKPMCYIPAVYFHLSV